MSSKYKEMEKEKIIAPLHRMKRAEPNPYLFTRIEASLKAGDEKSFSTDWFVRLAFMLGGMLIFINIMFFWFSTENQSSMALSEESEFELQADTTLYTSIIPNLNFYENGSE
jgi:hypothetical protein